MQLVLAVRKHLLEVLLGNLQAVETLLLLENLGCSVVKDLPICLFNNAAAKDISNYWRSAGAIEWTKCLPIRHGHVVEETLRGRRPVRKETPILAFASFTQTVSA